MGGKMILKEYVIEARTLMSGSEGFVVPVSEYVQIKKGPVEAPEVVLQEQCPVGKQWNVRVIVEITETDL